jgi:hypothetical protein
MAQDVPAPKANTTKMVTERAKLLEIRSKRAIFASNSVIVFTICLENGPKAQNTRAETP